MCSYLRPTVTAALAMWLVAAVGNAAPLVYQGLLMDSGQPANGRYDLRLTPHRDANSAVALAPAITFENVRVENGQFRVDADFAEALPADAELWLQVAVRDASSEGAFSEIGVREKATLGGPIGSCWSTSGDAGVIAGTHFLGTTDAQPLELRAQNQRVAQFAPGAILFGNPALPAQNVGIGTNTPAQKLDVVGNLRLSGAIMPNGIAGTAGQVLTSSGGGSPPTWKSTSFAGGKFSVRYDNTTAQTAASQTDNNFSTALNASTSQSALVSFFALDYNSNSDVTIDMPNHSFTFNRAGLYQLEGTLRFFVSSGHTQGPNLQAQVALQINGSATLFMMAREKMEVVTPPGSAANQYGVNIPFQTTRFFPAGTTVEIEVTIDGLDTNPALAGLGISRGGFFAGHFISE